MLSRRRALLAALVLPVPALVATAASYGVGGQATIAGETATLAPATGYWEPATNHVSLLFPGKALSDATLAASRRARTWNVAAAGRSVVVDLDFKPGQTSALEAQLLKCRVSARGFKTRFELQGSATDCRILSIGGLLSPPGGLAGIIQGSGANYALRLPFSLTFDVPGDAAAAPSTAKATAPATPADTAAGTGSFDGQDLHFTHGVAAWNAGDNEVRIALFDHAAPAGAVANLLKGEWLDDAPLLTLYLRVNGSPSPGAVTYCYIDLDFPRGGSLGKNTDGKGCGITGISGEIAAGGNVAVRLSGSEKGPDDKPFSWDARINLPISR